MLCIYRLSDFAQTTSIKPKLEHASKLKCLTQFLSIFGETNTIVVADGVSDSTYEVLKTIVGDTIVRTNHRSGAFSFMTAVDIALNSGLPEDTPVYLCEDDYLHTKDAKIIILEGLSIADYCTGYDHPDKYMNRESCQLYVTRSTHWRTTPSTTMTFAARISTLRQDRDVYMAYCQTGYPYDHEMFLHLGKAGRRLVSCIPGVSTHTEVAWLSPLVSWDDV